MCPDIISIQYSVYLTDWYFKVFIYLCSSGNIVKKKKVLTFYFCMNFNLCFFFFLYIYTSFTIVMILALNFWQL